MSALTHNDFAAFFRAVWGIDPFPWQQDLLTRLAAGEDARRGFTGKPGEWPAVLDLPTGSGKTAAIDIALFHLALEADKGAHRCAPVRIAFVVDRRLSVDDAHARAERLADVLGWSLLSAEGATQLQDDLAARRAHLVDVLRRVRAEPVVKRVASRLRDLAGPGQPPLTARRLRGGTPREDDWARTPVQPTILCSTVDQVGSRLLFRGYGVSDSMKPVHAGLLGSDCLILLDEAHLSEPFRQTLEAVGRLRGADRARAPFGFAVLTATPHVGAKSRFGLSAQDHADPILSARIGAPKPARLVGKQSVDTEALRVEVVVEWTRKVLEELSAPDAAAPAVGVVLNRVGRARAAFDRLRSELQESADVTLIIGPARAIDREDRAAELDAIRTRSADAPRTLPKPLVVVATQTIEAGVDIDFDGLVTEAASLDALRQRFGRLNRAGRKIAPKAAILAYKGDIGTKADDPVYGDRIARTWAKLKQLAPEPDDLVDFGIAALRERIGEAEAGALAAPTSDAPVLMPAYAHLWSQTAPIPNADPEVALFLHGPDRSPASVQIVWRSDIDEERDLKPAMKEGAQGQVRDRLVELLKLMPPRASEAIEVPLWAARVWLDRAGKAQDDFSDAVESGRDTDNSGSTARPACRWAGEDSEHTQVVPASKLRNGDLIVVPAGYGGCDRWGWSPRSVTPVVDIAEKAAWPYRTRRFAVRVTPALIEQELRPHDDTSAADDERNAWAARLRDALADRLEDRAANLLDAILMLGLPTEMAGKLERLKSRRGGLERSFAYGEGDNASRGVVFRAPRGLKEGGNVVEPSATPSTESEELGAESLRPLPLVTHCQDVHSWATTFAAAAGLPQTVAGDVALAALLHDTGKADRRYQAYFAGGNPYVPDRAEPLAKTGGKRLPPGAWKRAELPAHWRHEALSVRLARVHPDLERAHDKLLVLWLIGTHHGYGRPLFPHADSLDAKARPIDQPPALGGEILLKDEPGPQSLAFDLDGLDWAQIFEALKERYGIWGLARLEAFVRLADHRASEAEGPSQAAEDRKEAAE